MTFFSAEEFGRKVARDPNRLVAYSYAYSRNQEIQGCVQAGLDPDLVDQIRPEIDPEVLMDIAISALFKHLDSKEIPA